MSIKKLLKGEGVWAVRKDILGWIIDGATMCIELSEKKQAAILEDLKQALKRKQGLRFKKFEKLVGKLRQASIGIPAGEYLFGPINQLIELQPKIIYWSRAPAASVADNEGLGPADKRSGKRAYPCEGAGGGRSSLQGNTGCLWRRSRRSVAYEHKTPGTHGVEGEIEMATRSEGRPGDVVKPRRKNN